MSNQIFVGGLRDVNQRDVRKEFQRYGKIQDLQIKKDFAFIVSVASNLTYCIDIR